MKAEIILGTAADEPPINDASVQADINAAAADLRRAGLQFNQRGMAFDAVDAVGYPLAEFVLALVAVPLINAAKGVLIAWIKAHYGRSVTVKIGDQTFKAKDAEEIGELLREVEKAIQRQEQRQLPKD